MYHTNRDMRTVSREVQAILSEGKIPAPLRNRDEEAAQRIGLQLEGSGSLRFVTLPPGWEIKLEMVIQTSTVVGIIYDELNRRRAEFQYRHPDDCGTKVLCRFGIEYVQGQPAVVDRAANRVYFYVTKAHDVAYAKNWLTQNHPQWKDPVAYWYDGPADTLWQK